jgi:hypothetical protein
MDRSVPPIVAATRRRSAKSMRRSNAASGEAGRRGAFRCECARAGCNVLVSTTPREYERVRGDPRHFLIALGHELPEVERVVKTTSNYPVVEKFGEAGAIAEATDPRE